MAQIGSDVDGGCVGFSGALALPVPFFIFTAAESPSTAPSNNGICTFMKLAHCWKVQRPANKEPVAIVAVNPIQMTPIS